MSARSLPMSEPARAPRFAHLPGALLALLFFAWQAPAVNQRGWTWDESESRDAGENELRLVRGLLGGHVDLNALNVITRVLDTTESWHWHELPAYCFVTDTLRATFTRVVARSGLDQIGAMHLFNTILSAASIYVLYLLVIGVSGDVV